MLNIRILAILAAALALVGCAHPIVITPDMQTLEGSKIKPIDKTVGYYISSADREREVETPAGGGDKVKYVPYKELEPALQKVLLSVFKSVKRVDSADDTAFLKSNDIAFVFQPQVTTDSSSDSMMTWPPTNFTVDLNCKAIDRSGKVVWERRFSGKGQAEFSEFIKDHALSAKRASHQAFSELQTELAKAPEFRR